jgi:ketosteroid isomerase-like protein
MTDTLSAQKLEVVRRAWEAFESEPITLERLRAGKFDWLMEEFYSADVVFDLSALAGWPEAKTYEGYDGVGRFFEDWFGMFEEVSFELDRLEAVGDVVLAVAIQRGSGLSSRTPVEWRQAYLSAVQGSKIVRTQIFSDPDEAVRAAERSGPSG